MNKVIKMTKKIWDLPAGVKRAVRRSGFLGLRKSYCAIGKLQLAVGLEPSMSYPNYGFGENFGSYNVYSINDADPNGGYMEDGPPNKENHEMALKLGIRYLQELGYKLEVDEYVAKKLQGVN